MKGNANLFVNPNMRTTDIVIDNPSTSAGEEMRRAADGPPQVEIPASPPSTAHAARRPDGGGPSMPVAGRPQTEAATP